jgi:hypothetical protein
LLPDDRGRPKSGEEKTALPGKGVFSTGTSSLYRKVTAYSDMIEEYHDEVADKSPGRAPLQPRPKYPVVFQAEVVFSQDAHEVDP